MVSFDINSLFSTVPLEFSLELTLEWTYNKTELAINIPDQKWKKCCCCARKKFISAAIRISKYERCCWCGFPFRLSATEIFMVNFKRSLVRESNVYLNFWGRYVDDTITFIKIGSVLKVSVWDIRRTYCFRLV